MDDPGRAVDGPDGPDGARGDLVIEGLSVRFGDRTVVRQVSLTVPGASTVSLLGPSGSGKTTLLRVIAGLQAATSGSVRLGGRDLRDVPAHERGVGLMFQDFALFGHLDVGGNVGFGLRVAHQREARVRGRVAEVLGLVGLPGTERRAISTLSGGEQQRVALARALAPGPGVLLLDEPMGSLDRTLRERLPLELRSLFERLDVTVVYVTHDQDEALAVADRTVILHDGTIEADGAAVDLWDRPPTAFAARFLGYRNVVTGRLVEAGIETPWGLLPRPADDDPSGGPLRDDLGTVVNVLVRPRGTSLLPDSVAPPPGATVLHGIASALRFRGDHFTLVAELGDGRFDVELRGPPVPRVGERVAVAIEPEAVMALQPGPAILPP
jgi:thiamine transport system ATP-binding protein